MLSRIPERRKAGRLNSAGRRGCKRFVLESEIVVGITLTPQFCSAANVLDISMSGAYILLGGVPKPEINQIIDINFSDTQFVYPKCVKATIKYVNSSSLIGADMYGIGVEFLELLPKEFMTQMSNSKLIIAGTHVDVCIS